MGAYYDEIEIEDMAWDEEKRVYHYPCPCGDRFEISRSQLANYEDIAICPSCSLVIRVIYDPLDYEDEPPESDEGASESGGEDKDGDEESDGNEEFADALEQLTISEEPKTVAVGA
ncbi:zf-CSL-domain-containing protein [Dentipellis sp. KUC8613]|nr:zf-CSL-domain-containing protein [Dentipellis sp. KUC8613]